MFMTYFSVGGTSTSFLKRNPSPNSNISSYYHANFEKILTISPTKISTLTVPFPSLKILRV